MKTNQRYKLELTPYYLAKNEESCDLSATHLYGKFLNYIDEDDYIVVDLEADDVDAGDDFVFFAYADTSAVMTSINGESLTLDPIQDWNGTATITAGVSDGEYSDSTTFSLTVNALNDVPQAFTVLYPTAEDTFSTHENSDTPIPFTWQTSQDPDSEVDYTLTIELEFFSNVYSDVHEDISDTTYTVYSNTLDILLQSLNLDWLPRCKRVRCHQGQQPHHRLHRQQVQSTE